MGSDHLAPGKQALSPVPHNIAPAQPQAIVGKSNLYDHEHPTGEDGIDAGGQGGAGFLDKAQRAELNSQARFRLATISKNATTGCIAANVEQQLKKPEDLNFFMTMCLNLAESVLTGYGGTVVKMLLKPGGARTAISELGGATATELKAATQKAERSMTSLTEQQLNTAIKQGLARGKSKASSALTPTSTDDSAAAAEKAQALSYIDQLGAELDLAFDQLNQDIGKVDDGIALAWYRAMHPSLHTPAMWTDKIRRLVKQYIDSPVSRIGRSKGWDDGKHVEKETRIVRVVIPGAGVRYAEQDAVFDAYKADHPSVATRSPAYDAPQGALSLQQDATWNVDGKEVQRHERPIKPEQVKLNYVPHSLEEMAVQKQEHVWQKPIETYQLTFTDGHPKLVKIAGA